MHACMIILMLVAFFHQEKSSNKFFSVVAIYSINIICSWWWCHYGSLCLTLFILFNAEIKYKENSVWPNTRHTHIVKVNITNDKKREAKKQNITNFVQIWQIECIWTSRNYTRMLTISCGQIQMKSESKLFFFIR